MPAAGGQQRQLLVNGEHHQFGTPSDVKHHLSAVQLVGSQCSSGLDDGLGAAVVKFEAMNGGHIRFECLRQVRPAARLLHAGGFQDPHLLRTELFEWNEVGCVLASGNAQMNVVHVEDLVGEWLRKMQ